MNLAIGHNSLRAMHGAIGALAVALGLVAASSAPAQVIPKELPPPAQGLDIKERLGQKIDLNLPFVDSDGKPVTLKQYFNDGGKPVVLALVYFRCPMLCKTVLINMVRRFNELDWTIGEKFNVVVVSFDPTEGSAAAAEQKFGAVFGYGRTHPDSLDRSWAYLTGQANNSQRLADNLGFVYKYLPDSGEYSHPAVMFVLTSDGTVSRYLYGVDYPVNQLRLALLDASGGKIGSTLDRLLLFCYHWDPNSGSYTVSAMRLMQLGASASAGLVALVMGRMWVIERRRRRVAAGAVLLNGPIHTSGLTR